MNAIIANCRLISPEIDIPDASLYIEDGFIRKVYTSGDVLPDAEKTYDAKEAMAMPGFIDIHCHGASGYDFTDATVEALEAIAASKLSEGVTTMLATTLSLSVDQLQATFAAIARYMASQRYSRIEGVHLEGPYINANFAGAQNKDHIRKPDMEEVLGLNAIARIAIVSFAVELDDGFVFTRQLSANGIIPSCGHSGATYAQIMEAKHAGARHLTHFCNAMTGLHHREIGLVGSGLLDDNLLIELICDNVHLCPEMIALAFKIKPAEKIALITDSIAATGLADGDYHLGGLPVIVDHGTARLKSSGALAGSTLRFNDALENAWKATGLPLKKLVRTTSMNQALALGIENRGKLEPGYVADITILDKDFQVKAVFVGGEQRI